MISRGAREREAEIFQLLEKSYPNMPRRLLESLFRHRFDPQRCLYIAQDGKVIATLQMTIAQMRFRGYCLEVACFDQIATAPDYRRRHKLRELLQAANDEASHNQLFSLRNVMNPRLFERYGFKTVHTSKRYLLAGEECRRNSCANVRDKADSEQMSALYQRFISRFDGCFLRDAVYYDDLQQRVSKGSEHLCFYYENDTLMGYCLYLIEHQEVRVIEIVYLDSRSLKQMLSYVAQKVNGVLLVVSKAEKIERIFPFAIPRREAYLMARLNNIALFNKLYNCNVRHAADAFELLHKPMWNHHL